MKQLVAAATAGFCTFLAVTLPGCANQAEQVSAISQDLSPLSGATAQTADVEDGASVEQVSTQTKRFVGSYLPGVQDGPFDEASFLRPYGLCFDASGGLIIVDSYGQLIRYAYQDTVSTMAGNASAWDSTGYPLAGYREGNAAQAMFNRPRFATISNEGAVLLSDSGNHNIRVLYKNVVYLLAGNAEAGYQDGNYQTARFNTPSGVAVDQNGVVYVADTLNHCIRTISPDGTVATLSGSPKQAGLQDGPLAQARFCEPNDIAFGSDGALYIVDKGNQRIRKLLNGQVSTVAGSGTTTDGLTGYIVGGFQDGKADQAQFLYPTGLCITDTGVLYVADTGNNCIRSIQPDGTVATVWGGKQAGSTDGIPLEARLNQPIDVAWRDGVLYVSDSYNRVVRCVPVDEPVSSAGSPAEAEGSESTHAS